MDIGSIMSALTHFPDKDEQQVEEISKETNEYYIKDIVKCYETISEEEMMDDGMKRDISMVLSIMIIDKMPYYLPLLKERKYNIIYGFVVENISDTKALFNVTTHTLLKNYIPQEERCIIIRRLLKYKQFLKMLPLLECWDYQDAKMNKNKSFLGMIIRDYDKDTRTKFIKKVILKQKQLTIQWLCDILNQHQQEFNNYTDQGEISSDIFMVNLLEVLLVIYIEGRTSRLKELDPTLIYTTDFPLDFGQKKDSNAKSSISAFNMYFMMIIKALELSIMLFINTKAQLKKKVENIKEQINYIYNMRNNSNEYMLFTLMRNATIKTLNIKLEKCEKRERYIDSILHNKNIIESSSEVIIDLLYSVRTNIDYLTENIIEIILSVLTLNNEFVLDNCTCKILQDILDSKKLNYHIKIKLTELFMTLSITNKIDPELIPSLHRFYLELGANQIEDYYRFRGRYYVIRVIVKIICLFGKWNNELYLSHFVNLQRDNLSDKQNKYSEDYIKFIHNLITDSSTVLENTITYTNHIKDIERKLKNQSSLTQDTSILLNRQRADYSIMVKNSFVYLTDFTLFLEKITKYDIDIFNERVIREIFVTNMNYLLHNLIENNIELNLTQELMFKLLVSVGYMIHNISSDECILKYFILEDRFSIIDICKKLIGVYIKHKYFNAKIFYELIDNIDLDIKKMIIIKERIDKEQQSTLQDIVEDDIPEEFMDPIMMTLIEHPVELPVSKIILDKNTIEQQLLHCEQDPYSRTKLTMEILNEHNNTVEVKERMTKLLEKINNWKK